VEAARGERSRNVQNAAGCWPADAPLPPETVTEVVKRRPGRGDAVPRRGGADLAGCMRSGVVLHDPRATLLRNRRRRGAKTIWGSRREGKRQGAGETEAQAEGGRPGMREAGGSAPVAHRPAREAVGGEQQRLAVAVAPWPNRGRGLLLMRREPTSPQARPGVGAGGRHRADRRPTAIPAHTGAVVGPTTRRWGRLRGGTGNPIRGERPGWARKAGPVEESWL